MRKTITVTAFFLVSLGTLFVVSDVQASSCSGPVKYIALCEEGICDEGFSVHDYPYYASCAVRPVVSDEESNDIKDIFNLVGNQFQNVDFGTGIYQIDSDFRCLPPQFLLSGTMSQQDYIEILGEEEFAKAVSAWLENCQGRTDVTLLSSDATNARLEGYKNTWLQTERSEYRKLLILHWAPVFAIAIIVFTAVVVPWTLRLRKTYNSNSWLKRLVVIFQVAIFILIPIGLLSFLSSTPPEPWEFALFIGFGVFVVSIIAEKVYTIIHRTEK